MNTEASVRALNAECFGRFDVIDEPLAMTRTELAAACTGANGLNVRIEEFQGSTPRAMPGGAAAMPTAGEGGGRETATGKEAPCTMRSKSLWVNVHCDCQGSDTARQGTLMASSEIASLLASWGVPPIDGTQHGSDSRRLQEGGIRRESIELLQPPLGCPWHLTRTDPGTACVEHQARTGRTV